MTHDEFVASIRTRFADLFDPANTEAAWEYLITIDRGWWSLLESYCEQAQAILRQHDEVGRWHIRQVKEKFGELRIYMRPATYELLDVDGFPETVEDIDPPAPTPVQELLSELRARVVEQASSSCEDCGEPGDLRVLDGWYHTCCDQHFVEWQARKAGR
jgi:hypothetical protein